MSGGLENFLPFDRCPPLGQWYPRMQNLLTLLLTLVLAGCMAITYVEPSGPGEQHDGRCARGVFDTMTIRLTEFDTDVHVSISRADESAWVELRFQSLHDIDLQILASQVALRSERPGRRPTAAHLARVQRASTWTPVHGERQSMVDDQPVVGATVRAFGDLNVGLFFEIPSADLPAAMDFPKVALGGRPVSVGPIRLQQKSALVLAICG